MVFKDRRHAGELLAKQVEKRVGKNTVVVGIPRGGIVVARVVADRLNVPLDFIAVEKIGAPGNSEFALGALGPENQIVLDQELVERMGIPPDFINKAVGQEGIELERKERAFRGAKPAEKLQGKTVILVDDGIATGATVEVAIKSIQAQGPEKLILAVPVAPQEALRKLEPLVDELFCLVVPSPFMAVGQFYENFDQTEDEEVVELLRGS
jgi:predicted phosphoribosyltransferase